MIMMVMMTFLMEGGGWVMMVVIQCSHLLVNDGGFDMAGWQTSVRLSSSGIKCEVTLQLANGFSQYYNGSS